MHCDLFINGVIKFTKSDNYCITIINNSIIIIIAVGGSLVEFICLFIRADDTQIIIIFIIIF